jgi:glycosyltransferase involved in cell wall biosynthesis
MNFNRVGQGAMPRKILHVLGTAESSAAAHARVIKPLLEQCDPARYAWHVWFLGPDGPVAQELKSAGACVRVLSWRRGRKDPGGAFEFWRALRASRFDLVHQHAGGASVRWLVRSAGRARIVLHLHGYVADESAARPAVSRPRQTDAVIANSRATARYVAGPRPLVVYPGLSWSEMDRATEGSAHASPIVGVAGRLVAIKGFVYVLRALPSLVERFPDVQLEIAGEGPEEERLRRAAADLGIAVHVRFLGWQTDLAACLRRWDVFAQPSLEEGFGIAVVEAMAAGLPVVASNVGGLVEIVENGETGWLVPPRSPADLTARLAALLADPQQRQAMGDAGRERARARFSVARMVGDITTLYDRLLEHGANGAGSGAGHADRVTETRGGSQ